MVGNDLVKCDANYGPLTPLTFIQRSAEVYPERESVIYGHLRYTWAQTLDRCRRMASFLCSPASSVSAGDTVAVVAPNVPALYELHFAVPMARAVLNAINMRLDARTISVILQHAGAKVVFVDTEFLPLVYKALWIHFPSTAPKPKVVHILDVAYGKAEEVGAGEFGTYLDYEVLINRGDPGFAIRWPEDEWDAISINYTSGTTSAPKGVVYHHRGAYINSLVSCLDLKMQTGAKYLWTLPMFHCNGWCFTWSVAAQAGTNICMRNVTPKGIFDAIVKYKVTHICGAPTVLNIMAHAQEHEKQPLPHRVVVMTGGAPPTATIVATMENLGFDMFHGYGLTETFGPATICAWKDEWDSLGTLERAQLKARQGVGHLATTGVQVMDSESMVPVPRDGKTMGEVMIKGHAVMKGYLKDHKLTEDAFKGGWFHTGDLGVMHPDGYLQLKDRSKDIIISGGENISSIEVESILFRHPQILEAAVVACPDPFWGEIPCAFVSLKNSVTSESVSEKSIIEWSRANMPHFMAPRIVIFGTLPKTVTGKVQKNVLREQTQTLHRNKPPSTKSKL